MTYKQDQSLVALWDGRYHRPKLTLYKRYALRNVRVSFPSVGLDWRCHRLDSGKEEIRLLVRIYRYMSQVRKPLPHLP